MTLTCRRLADSINARRDADRRRYDFTLIEGGSERRELSPRAVAKLLEHGEWTAREDGLGRLEGNLRALEYVELLAPHWDVRTNATIRLQLIRLGRWGQWLHSTGYNSEGTTGYEKFLEPCMTNQPETDSEFTRGLVATLERS